MSQNSSRILRCFDEYVSYLVEVGMGKLFLISCLIFSSTSAYAWIYEEHYEITQRAYVAACANLQSKLNVEKLEKLKVFCANDKIIGACLGHMAALAADEVRNPDELVNIRKSWWGKTQYLKNENLDCQNITRYLSTTVLPENLIDPRKFQIELKPVDPLGFWESKELVVTNTEHFQPDSKDSWKKRLDEITKKTASPKKCQGLFAQMAFALHFLEDSFAAGHNGLERKYLRHDYDQAYHDDINDSGIFLGSLNGEWFSYGDSHLNDVTYYLRLTNTDHSSVKQSVLDLLRAIKKEYVEDDPDFFDKASKGIPESKRLVLALQVKKGVQLSICHYFDNCDRFEVILLPSNTPDPCEEKVIGVEAFRCKSSNAQVVDTATRGIEAFLLYLIDEDQSKIDEVAKETAQNIPYRYFPPTKTLSKKNSQNNKNLILGYSSEPNCYDQKSCANNERATEKNGDDLASVKSNNNLPFMTNGYSMQYLNGGKTQGFAPIGYALEQCLDNPQCSFRLENRLGLVDQNNHIFSSYDGSVYFFSNKSVNAPKFPHVLGLYGKASIGLDSLWDKSWNGYWGAGASADIHIGKTIIFVDIDRLRHKSFGSSDHFYSTRFTLGMRITHIRFSDLK